MLPFGNFQKDFNRNYKSTKNWKTKKRQIMQKQPKVLKSSILSKRFWWLKANIRHKFEQKYCFMILSNLVLAIELISPHLTPFIYCYVSLLNLYVLLFSYYVMLLLVTSVYFLLPLVILLVTYSLTY